MNLWEALHIETVAESSVNNKKEQFKIQSLKRKV